MSYTFGGPELLRKLPETIAGSKDDGALYIPVNATIRILLRVPEGVGGPGEDVASQDFEPELRQRCAEAMVGIVTEKGFIADSVCVQEFQPGGA